MTSRAYPTFSGYKSPLLPLVARKLSHNKLGSHHGFPASSTFPNSSPSITNHHHNHTASFEIQTSLNISCQHCPLRSVVRCSHLDHLFRRSIIFCTHPDSPTSHLHTKSDPSLDTSKRPSLWQLSALTTFYDRLLELQALRRFRTSYHNRQVILRFAVLQVK